MNFDVLKNFSKQSDLVIQRKMAEMKESNKENSINDEVIKNKKKSAVFDFIVEMARNSNGNPRFIDFMESLLNFYNRNEYFTPKQMNRIIKTAESQNRPIPKNIFIIKVKYDSEEQVIMEGLTEDEIKVIAKYLSKEDRKKVLNYLEYELNCHL